MDRGDAKDFLERAPGLWDDSAGVIDAVAGHGRVTARSRVADRGNGRGVRAADLAGRAATVTGIDNSPAMLAVAAGRVAALSAGNVQLAAGELGNLPLAGDGVDVAVSGMVLHHAPDPVSAGQVGIWLGCTPDQIEGYFRHSRLAGYGYASLGTQ